MKSLEWPSEAERDLLSDACVPGRHPHSFWNFVRFASGWHFRCLEPGQPAWLTARVHRPFCDWLQSHIEDWKAERRAGIQRRRKLLIWVFRGFGKSNIVTKCVPLYCMLDEPNMSSYIGSETHPKAKEFLAPMKAVIDGSDPFSYFTWLFGNWFSPERTWTLDTIVTAYRTALGVTEPSIGTFGVETGITGKHPLLLNFDDPISKEKIKEGGTFVQAAVDSFIAIYPALRNDSLFLFEGTRYLESDVIGHILRNEGVASWTGHSPPAKYPEGDWHVYFLQARDLSKTSVYPKGEPVLPEAGWDDRSLLNYEKAMPFDYAVQMMGTPDEGEHKAITREQIDSLRITRKDVPPIEYATIHLDTAFKVNDRIAKGDRNAIVGWLHDIRPTGIVYLDRVLYSAKWRSEDFDTHLVSYLQDLKRRGYRVRAITDEVEVGGKRGVYRNHLQHMIQAAGLRCPEIIQFNRSGTKKEVRIREAAGYWIEGFVRIPDDAQNADVLINEMLSIGFATFDDVSDAAADVFRPEVWRGRHQLNSDGEPYLPLQPGDEVLKGRFYQEVQELHNKIHNITTETDEDNQPFEKWIAGYDNGHIRY